ncbi:hypothetical protein GCM10007063_01140 [Lentibacillus kapialis]|uniref:DUF4901 domain-containing protein n=1 Tax=Lentibacillus kapialis TaxID=340214 RepID=A0A917USR6_9BACI|nr:hypothetical protein [Lentibacillus kapialis]GGJ82423.1 hypothetical protein GCM10007063_01140 [Lentibacillus kapialis]
MDKQLQAAVDYARDSLGLHDHQLKRYQFFRDKNHFNETNFILNMEWHPIGNADDALNPAGTAVVDINFYTKAVRLVEFIGGVNNADSSLYPSSTAKEDVIEWIEEMTGLTFGRQFLIAHEKEQVLKFAAAVDNIPVSPSGMIRVEFNKDGLLTVFSIDGEFPDEAQIEWEPFALTPDKYEPFAKIQCQLWRLPDQEQEKWLSVYGIEEVFLTNDAARTIPFMFGANRSSFIAMDKLLQWEEPLDSFFEQKDIDLSPEVELETVLANKPHPDTIPLLESETTAAVQEVLRFMRQVYPDENGTCELTGVYLKDGYIVAEIQPVQDASKNAPYMKVKLLIDRDTLTAVNYIDQNVLFKAYSHFTIADDAVVSLDKAFESLREHMEVEPVYVYDSGRSSYIMCGKLDCAYGINAVTGKVVALNEIV